MIKKYHIKERQNLFVNDTQEGERIEQKIERVVHNNEPISDGAPLIYTNRKDGVGAQYNIRTDRFEVAIDAMDKVAKSYTARRDSVPDMKVEKGGEKTEGQSISGSENSGENSSKGA